MDTDFSLERRDAAVRDLLSALRSCCRGSQVSLRGSLAAETADQYSDIDLNWVVPDDAFAECVEHVADYLNRTRPLYSVRSDPNFQHSSKRRLLFFLFRDLPLFWRVDLEMWAVSVADEHTFDADNPDARGHHWSRTASALANAVAAIKAIRRGEAGTAASLLNSGLERIGVSACSTGHWLADVTRLTSAAAEQDASVTELAEQVRALAAAMLDMPR